MDEIWLVLRWINIALYGGVVSGLLMHWRFLLNTPEAPTSRVWLWSLIAVGMYGTCEVVFLGQPGGFRIILMTVTLIGLFISLYIRAGIRILHRLTDSGRNLGGSRAEKR